MVGDYIECMAGAPFEDLRDTAHDHIDDAIGVIESDRVPRLIHDDFRPANMLFDPADEGPITAVLD
jgi:aminoglycoside phosphotransferase (APT) family kinase protein